MSEQFFRVKPEQLFDVICRILQKEGFPEEDAKTVAEVLLAADIRGIDSHGVSRMGYYLVKLQGKTINTKPKISIVNENGACALVDGDDGMGPVVGKFSMKLAIEKAKKHGAGFVAVRRSNHYGIAGYYSMMALEHDMIGISTTNAVCMVAPTFGAESMLGTNPISVAFPCGEEKPWVLDMATSTAPFGKLELAIRNQTGIPLGWVQDSEGRPWDDPQAPSKGGALTPLGATPEMASHKGYGLAALVDVLSGILSGALYGPKQEGLVKPRSEPSNVGHFFGAIRLDGFRPPGEFKKTMDEMIRGLRGSKKAAGCDRIYTHGEKEFDQEEERMKHGIPLHPLIKGAIEFQARSRDVPIPWLQ